MTVRHLWLVPARAVGAVRRSVARLGQRTGLGARTTDDSAFDILDNLLHTVSG